VNLGDAKTVVLAALLVVVLFSVHRFKGFPSLKRGHVYQVTVELEPGKTDQDVAAMMAELKQAYGETWVDWKRLDATHIQWSFMADQDEPAPTGIPKEWADRTVVDDLGPRVIV
jgi:hypothetical protein